MPTNRLDDPDPLTSRSEFKLAVWIVGALLATAAVGYAIGVTGAAKGTSFDWTIGAVAATAFATTVLAAFTGTLAASTVIEQQRRDRVLVAVRLATPQQERPEGPISYAVTLRNVGESPANYVSVAVQSEDSAGAPLMGTSTNDHFLKRGEETTIVVELAIAPRRPTDLPEDIRTRVYGVYLDTVSRPGYFVWQHYRWGGSSFLFKTKPWSPSDLVPRAADTA